MIKDNNRSYPNYNKDKKLFKDNDSNNVIKKPLRYGEDDLNKTLLGKNVKVTLVNGREIAGVLSNLGMYDVTIKTKAKQVFNGNITREVESSIIILKSALATVEVE
jgi:hypothetical protein